MDRAAIKTALVRPPSGRLPTHPLRFTPRGHARRVLGLHPVGRAAGAIARGRPLRHDAFEAMAQACAYNAGPSPVTASLSFGKWSGTEVAAVALANKIARMAWAMMVRGERFKCANVPGCAMSYAQRLETVTVAGGRATAPSKCAGRYLDRIARRKTRQTARPADGIRRLLKESS